LRIGEVDATEKHTLGNGRWEIGNGMTLEADFGDVLKLQKVVIRERGKKRRIRVGSKEEIGKLFCQRGSHPRTIGARLW
jgi:hypothetical protein